MRDDGIVRRFGENHRYIFELEFAAERQKVIRVAETEMLAFDGDVSGFGDTLHLVGQRAFHAPETFDEFEIHKMTTERRHLACSWESGHPARQLASNR